MPDILLATLIFLLVLVGLYEYAINLPLSGQSALDRKTLDGTTANVAEYLLKNPGNPTNWETLTDSNQIIQIGLAQKDRVLSLSKVVAFVNLGNLNYSLAKQKINIPHYDFYAVFTGGVDLSTGQASPGNTDTSVVQRFVTINGVETTFTLTLYES